MCRTNKMDLRRYYSDRRVKEKMAMGCAKSILESFDCPEKERVYYEITYSDIHPIRHKVLAEIVVSVLYSSGFWATFIVKKKRGEYPTKGSIAYYQVERMTPEVREAELGDSDSDDEEEDKIDAPPPASFGSPQSTE